ncbi:hypothetical protein BJV74DRAFT_792603 [Russula compacta]|nr:hypothetical protein BJV74DRAFT_792603 [Russula compacta]
MPCKKHAVKSRCKNAEKARNVKVQRPCKPFSKLLRNVREIKRKKKYIPKMVLRNTRMIKNEKAWILKMVLRLAQQENLAKQGYLSVLKFMAYVEKTANKRPHTERLTASPVGSKHPPESEESDTKDVVSKYMGQEEEDEEDEQTANSLYEDNSGHTKVTVKTAPDASRTQEAIQALLESISHRCALVDNSPPSMVNNALSML